LKKKKQKNFTHKTLQAERGEAKKLIGFAPLHAPTSLQTQMDKSFLLLFFKKEALALPTSLSSRPPPQPAPGLASAAAAAEGGRDWRR
jgi:hypothetical protein